MKRPCRLTVLVTAFLLLTVVGAFAAPPVQLREDHADRMRQGLKLFRERVATILKADCLACHGPQQREANLDLSRRETLLKGGDSGRVINLGKPAASRLLRRVVARDDTRMPKDAEPLSAAKVEALRKWIQLGAPYDGPLVGKEPVVRKRPITDEQRRFWAFRPLAVEPPRVAPDPVTRRRDNRRRDKHWAANPIDRYILARLRQHALRPAGPVSRRKLIRRVTFDLLGLPPTPAEIDAFVNDTRPDAWPRLVERLLASPAYGERWARHWLDIVRFAESYGFEHDLDNEHAFHYRDFVIWALNRDLPYDQFVRWQIAGDELQPNNPLARIATGFLAAGVRNADIAKVRVEQERYDELDDLAATVGTSMLGISIGCARCHDHKFDPISQQNYYQFVATFERTVRGEVELPSLANSKKSKVLVAGEGVPPLARVYNPGPAFFTKTWFLRRGDARLKSHTVLPGFLEVLTPADASPGEWHKRPATASGSTYRRSALAHWMTDVDRGAGALLARVLVNRLWQHHLGRGIVATPSDFGFRGERPSHPQLLDYLASELIRNRWSLKHVHRLILQSATYRQGRAVVPTQRDATLFRGHRLRRLEAEVIRDQMLWLSGSIDRRMYGPGTLQEDHPRRSIYFRVKRSRLIPSMVLFDAPDALQGIGRRPTTTVAPQALALLNAPPFERLAVGFARRLRPAASRSLADAVRQAYREALGRSPVAEELNDAVAFIGQQTRAYATVSRKKIASPVALRSAVVRLDAAQLKSGPVSRLTAGSRHTIELRQASRKAPQAVKGVLRFGPEATFLRSANHRSLNFGTGDFSITVMFRYRAPSNLLGKDTYPGKGNSYTGYFLQVMKDRLRFATRDLRSGKGPQNYLDSESVLRKDQWHRATVVRSAGTLHMYLDEASSIHKSMPERTATNVNAPTGLKIGEMDDHDAGSFQGDLAEVLIYNRALTPREVRDNHRYLQQKHVGVAPRSSLEDALTDFCQALFCICTF